MNYIKIAFLIAHNYLTSFAFPMLENCLMLDLTHEFSNNGTIYWGGMEKFQHTVDKQGFVEPGHYYYESFKLSGPEHGGTHFDAPAHFSQVGQSSEKVRLENLIGEACVVDVSTKVKLNSSYQLSVNDLQEWEKANGQLSDHCIVIMRTGWESKYGNINEYFGTATPSDTKSYNFPGLSPEAAQWLVDSNRLRAFGIDTASVDYGQTVDFKTHRILSSKNISGFENLKNVDKLPARGATIIAFPMKIAAGSGGPLRAAAFGWNGPYDACRRKSSAANLCRLTIEIYLIIFAILSIVTV